MAENHILSVVGVIAMFCFLNGIYQIGQVTAQLIVDLHHWRKK